MQARSCRSQSVWSYWIFFFRVVQRSPTGPSQLTGCSLSWLGTCITALQSEHTHQMETLVPVTSNPYKQHHLQRTSQGSTGTCISIQLSLFRSILDFEVKHTQEFNPTCKLSLGIFGLDIEAQRSMITSNAESYTLQTMPMLFNKLNNFQEFTTDHTIVLFGLGQCPNCKRNGLFQPVLDLWKHSLFHDRLRRCLA